MTKKLSKILLTIAITTLLSITFIPTSTKAETSDNGDNIDIKDFYTTTLQYTFNSCADFFKDGENMLSPQRQFSRNIINYYYDKLKKECHMTDWEVYKLVSAGRYKSEIYKAQMRQFEKAHELINY